MDRYLEMENDCQFDSLWEEYNKIEKHECQICAFKTEAQEYGLCKKCSDKEELIF